MPFALPPRAALPCPAPPIIANGKTDSLQQSNLVTYRSMQRACLLGWEGAHIKFDRLALHRKILEEEAMRK